MNTSRFCYLSYISIYLKIVIYITFFKECNGLNKKHKEDGHEKIYT